MVDIHASIGAELQGFGGFLRCESCRMVRSLGDVGGRLRDGWPECCGYTMRWWTQRQIDAGEHVRGVSMIDLVRLKEAMNEAQESEQGAGMALVGPAFELVDAVLDAPTVWCDPCIAPLVEALQPLGTVASCCGHGNQPGNVVLADGRELFIVADYETARAFDEMVRLEGASDE